MKRFLVLTFSVLLFMGPVPGSAHTAAAGESGESDAAYPRIIQVAEAGDCAAVESLIEGGADITVKARDGSPLLLVAAQKGCLDACRMLLDSGVEPDGRNDAGDTPLLIALFWGQPEIARLLFERGADIMAVKDDGSTALYLATLGGDQKSIDIVFELLRAKSDAEGMSQKEYARMMSEYVNKAEKNGWTPLMNAAWDGNVGLIKKLVELGADVDAADKKGITALVMARRSGKTEAEKLLKELGAK